MDADVLVSSQVRADLVTEIEAAFRDAGLSAAVRRVPARRGPAELGWLVIATIPLSSFLTTLTAKLAEDSYKGLRQLTRRVLSRAAAPATGTLVLEDRGTGTQVVLEADLPDDAYRALLASGLTGTADVTMRYDRSRQRWVADA